MKLSEKQKEVIKEMREGRTLRWLYSSQKYSQKSILGNYQIVLDATVHVLVLNKIISVVKPEDYYIKRFELTELGKTIEL